MRPSTSQSSNVAYRLLDCEAAARAIQPTSPVPSLTQVATSGGARSILPATSLAPAGVVAAGVNAAQPDQAPTAQAGDKSPSTTWTMSIVVPLVARATVAAAMMPIGWRALLGSISGSEGVTISGFPGVAAGPVLIMLAAAHLIGGAFLLFGLFTRVSALVMTTICVLSLAAVLSASVAIGVEQFGGQLMSVDLPAAKIEGIFYSLALILSSSLLVFTGGGAVSLDRAVASSQP